MIAPRRPRDAGGREARQRAEDRALVLRRFPYGESSLVVHLLTPESGKVSVLAKGAYRAKSGYCGVLDLFDTLTVAWSRSPRTDLGNLTAAAIERRRGSVATALPRYQAGLAMLELAAVGAREQHEERALFSLSEAALDALQDGRAEPLLVRSVADLKFLALQGLTPALDHCALCGRAERAAAGSSPRGPEPRVPFAAGLGGRLCAECARSPSARGVRIESLPAGTLRVAKSLLDTPLAQLDRIRLDPRRTEELGGFSGRFLEYHLEVRLRARHAPRP